MMWLLHAVVSVVLNAISGFAGMFFGMAAFAVVTGGCFPIYNTILSISKLRGGPGKRWCVFGVTLITLVICASAYFAAWIVWLWTGRACLHFGFAYGPAIKIGTGIGVFGAAPMFWVIASSSFANACSLADSKLRKA